MGKERWETDEDVSDAMGDLIEENRQLRTELSSLKEQMLTAEEAEMLLGDLFVPEYANPEWRERILNLQAKLRRISSLSTDTEPKT